MNDLDVVNRLDAFAVSSQAISGDKSKGDLYILILNTETKKVKYKIYTKTNLTKAIEDYLAIEKETKDDSTKDVVLVSADSVIGLKKAYPNYFADTHEFVKTVYKIIGKKLKKPMVQPSKLENN